MNVNAVKGIFVESLGIIPQNGGSREAKHFGGIEMQEMAISRTIGQVRQRLEENGYSKGKIAILLQLAGRC